MTDGPYFFLSYAHLPPADDSDSTDDPVVTAFFDDLSAEVRERAGKEPGLDVGAYDRAVPSGEDVRAAVARALGRAQVLVPLYSPRYVSGTWPMSEYQAFLDRLQRIDGDASDHIQPVLWVPLPPGQTLPGGAHPADLADGSTDYATNGLRMLRELNLYRPQYNTFVRRLAQRIVDVAQTSPIGSSTSLTFSESNPAPGTAQFVIAVIAPTLATLPAERRPEAYGQQAVDWRPFVGRAQSAARQAATVSERLGLPTATTGAMDFATIYENTPSLLLIDPWVLATASGRSTMEEAVRGLADWIIPVVVSDEQDPQYAERGRALAEEALSMLAGVGTHRVSPDVRTAVDLADTVPMLVMQARRRFLRSRPRTGPRRPRLSDQPGPGEIPPTSGADDR